MPIQPTQPIVIPAIAEKTADALWLKSLVINAPDINSTVNISVMLTPYISTTGEMFHEKSITLELDNVLTLAAAQPELANTMQVLFTEIERQAKSKNLI